MLPQPSITQRLQDDMSRLTEENNDLRLHVNHLNRQVHILRGQVYNLVVENARLRTLLSHKLPLPSGECMYAEPDDNVLYLPVVIESLAVMRGHFQRQGTLKQCSHPRCHEYAFDQMCFRDGHMGWCRAHSRIVTGEWTSCSVKASDRGDCVPIWWEHRHDWTDIVNRAYREGRIGHRGLKTADLNAVLFSPVYDPGRIGAAESTYRHSN